MKILLIYPYVKEKRVHEDDISVVPMGLFYIGALLLSHGHDVRILNGFGLKSQIERIKEVLISYNADIIGFSVLNANRWGAIEIAKMAKKVNPEVHVVFGGVAATYLWHHFLTHFDVIDTVVLGEGELTLLELVTCLAKRRPETISKVAGLAYRENGLPICNSPRAPVSHLDDLPDPAQYFTFQHVALTRGCPHQCTFCGSPDFWGRKVRFHSADYFVEQLERLYQKGVRHFFFSDDTLTLRKEIVIEVCRQIVLRNWSVTWVAISRVDHIDVDILTWMRRAGCTQISYGVESGSPKIRKILGKNISDAQIEYAFRLTTRYGILARAYFIYGSPGETLETLSETIDLIRRIKPLAAIFYILTLFPGTELYDRYARERGLNDDTWLNSIEDILYFELDENLTQEEILAFGKFLRTEYHRYLPQFVEDLELIDETEFYPLHADFLSRLGLTFSHGDYSGIEEIPAREETSISLFQKALGYHPDLRAFLALGSLYQKRGQFTDSIKLLERGLRVWPDHPPLIICLGISLLNTGAYQRALDCFERFPDSEESRRFAPICRNALKGA